MLCPVAWTGQATHLGGCKHRQLDLHHVFGRTQIVSAWFSVCTPIECLSLQPRRARVIRAEPDNGSVVGSRVDSPFSCILTGSVSFACRQLEHVKAMRGNAAVNAGKFRAPHTTPLSCCCT